MKNSYWELRLFTLNNRIPHRFFFNKVPVCQKIEGKSDAITFQMDNGLTCNIRSITSDALIQHHGQRPENDVA